MTEEQNAEDRRIEAEAQKALVESTGTHKERDVLLVYKSIDTALLEKSEVLDVEIDNVNRDEALAKTLSLLEQKRTFRYIVFLDPIRLMYFRRKPKGRELLDGAGLILADGGGLRWGSKKLGHPLKDKISTISYMMDLIRLAEKRDLTIFLLGAEDDTIERTFLNLSRSFPEARIVGRHSGYFVTGEREAKVKEAIRKTDPDIIFLGMGFPEEYDWFTENREFFPNSFVVPVGGALDILSGSVRKAPDFFQLRGLAWLWRLIAKPWRIGRWLLMWQYYILVYSRRIFGKQAAKRRLKRIQKEKAQAEKQAAKEAKKAARIQQKEDKIAAKAAQKEAKAQAKQAKKEGKAKDKAGTSGGE